MTLVNFGELGVQVINHYLFCKYINLNQITCHDYGEWEVVPTSRLKIIKRRKVFRRSTYIILWYDVILFLYIIDWLYWLNLILSFVFSSSPSKLQTSHWQEKFHKLKNIILKDQSVQHFTLPKSLLPVHSRWPSCLKWPGKDNRSLKCSSPRRSRYS